MAPPVPPSTLDAARVGAGWAFEQIYGELAGPVAGYLSSQGVDDAEGETNEVFLRAFRHLDHFDGDATALRSWLFTIAHNRVVDHRRFRSRRPRQDNPLDADEPASAHHSAPSAAEEALARLSQAALVRQLEMLVSDQRDVLLLRFVADLSLEETAAAMGRSVGAVKALQHRAVAAVRRRLEEILPEAVSRPTQASLTGV